MRGVQTAKRRWEEFIAASEEADSLDRKLGHAMGFGLMRPPELGGMPVGTRQA